MKNIPAKLIRDVLIWTLAVLLILIFPLASVAVMVILGRQGGGSYPSSGHPDITYVEVSTHGGRWIDTHTYVNVSILYVSTKAKRAMQGFINARLPEQDPWPAWWHERRRFPNVRAIVSFVYPFQPPCSARAKIYKVPGGFFMLLYHHSDAPEQAYYVHGRSAAAYRRLFKPLFSAGLPYGYGYHGLHLSF